jgi:hypothetical protein
MFCAISCGVNFYIVELAPAYNHWVFIQPNTGVVADKGQNILIQKHTRQFIVVIRGEELKKCIHTYVSTCINIGFSISRWVPSVAVRQQIKQINTAYKQHFKRYSSFE